jgi:hypothetical protein
MSMAYIGFKWTPSLSLGLRLHRDSTHSPLRPIRNLTYEMSKQRTSQLQPTLNMQGIVKDNDLNGLLSSPLLLQSMRKTQQLNDWTF